MKKKVLQVKAYSALLDSQTSKNPAHLTHQCNMSSKIPWNTLSSSQKLITKQQGLKSKDRL